MKSKGHLLRVTGLIIALMFLVTGTFFWVLDGNKYVFMGIGVATITIVFLLAIIDIISE